MSDDAIREWATTLVADERHELERARMRFCRKPTAEHLHKLRTTARRLRSLLEDVADIIDVTHIRKRLKPLISATGTARDAAVIREALRPAIDGRERDTLRPFLRTLRNTERRCLRKVRSRARRTSLA